MVNFSLGPGEDPCSSLTFPENLVSVHSVKSDCPLASFINLTMLNLRPKNCYSDQQKSYYGGRLTGCANDGPKYRGFITEFIPINLKQFL